MIRVSKFYKDSKEGKFISYLSEDTRTLYDTFRKGAKESSKKFLYTLYLRHFSGPQRPLEIIQNKILISGLKKKKTSFI